MGGFGCGSARTAGFLLLLAVACLAARAALAVPVTDFVDVQPIDVCGVTCVPINNLGAGKNIWSNAPVGDVGFVSSGINVTRAIWNQIGIDVTYLPPMGYVNGNFLTVSVTSCAANGTDCQSPNFQTLSDQNSIAKGNPPHPTPPLSRNPTTLNTFFINSLSPPANQPGTLFGLSWINNNGIAIASNSLLGLGARPDTLAHEIGHTLDLDHNTFGAGTPPNLMTAGNTRNLPSTANPLATLGKTTDQLLTEQLDRVLLSGFVNPIPNIVTNVTDPIGHGDFSVDFANKGRNGESLKTLTLTAPAGTYLEYGTYDRLPSEGGSSGIVVTPAFSDCTRFGGTKGCQSLELTFSGSAFELGDSFDYTVAVCQANASRSEESGGSEWGDRSRCKTVPLRDLADALENGTYTYQFSDGFQTTSVLTGSDLLSASSWDPDPTIPSQIYDEALLYEADLGILPCTPTDGVCPELGLEDGSPIDEGTLVPEPSSLLILAAALFTVSAAGRSRIKLRAPRYSKPAFRSPSRM